MPNEASDGNSPAMVAMKQRLGGFETEEGRLKGLDFKPRPDDVFVVTTPKAGTTWMQQIVHQLRCLHAGIDGMDFEEISEVIPFIETAHDLGHNLATEVQPALPRAYKTHAWYPHCPKGAKYIVVVRDPKDVCLSFYKFFEGWFFKPGEVTFTEFINEFVLARGKPASRMNNASYWEHLLSWWPHRHSKKVLLVFYEDLLADLPSVVDKVARFIGTVHSDEAVQAVRQAEVVRRSTFAFMKAHEGQFDEHVSKRLRNPFMGLPPEAGLGSGKVRAGRAGGHKELMTEDLGAAIDAKWEQVSKRTGYKSYQNMREGWAKQCNLKPSPVRRASKAASLAAGMMAVGWLVKKARR